MTAKTPEDEHRYDDIIDLPHHVSKTHPQMPMRSRAAQFAPFAALSGYEEAVKETARLTEEERELDEYEREELDHKLQILIRHWKEQPRVTITYFKPDSKKSGGSYVDVTGIVRKIDADQRMIWMEDDARIPMGHVSHIELPTKTYKTY